MYPNLGKIKPGTIVFVPFHTFSSDDPSASMTITGLATSDIEVYKDASMTQRSSDAGYTLVDTDGIDIDTITGFHGVTIDLSDNTDSGFWEAGSNYVVVVSSITLDGATVNFIAARFSIGYEGALLDTTIASLSSQTSFTLEDGPADDNALNGCPVIIHDVASAVQVCIGYVSDYTGSTKTVTLAADPGIFTMAAGDNISFFMPSNIDAIGAGKQSATDLKDFADAGYDPATSKVQGVVLTDTCTTNTDMRGTDNAALASVVGALADAAAAGDPTSADTLMQYIKQLINILVGTTGITTFPAESGPNNNVSLAEVIRAIHADVTGLNGDAMRGTDGANTTTPPTVEAISDQVWDEAKSGHVGAGSFGEEVQSHATPTEVNAQCDTALTDYDPPTRAEATSDKNEIITEVNANETKIDTVDTVVDAIKAVTDNLPDSGALNDLATILADTNELQTDWANGGRLDLILDACSTAAKLKAYVQLLARSDAAIETDNSAELTEINADEGSGAGNFSSQTEGLEALRDRGDAAWVTGGGGSISDIINIQPLIPKSIDLANTATFRFGLMLVNSLDDLPSTAEITPGTISIERKAIGGTSWSAVVTDAACSEIAGLIYYDEVFDSGTGYAEGDSIRVTFKSQKVTVAANDYEIIGTTGRMFYTSIRQTVSGGGGDATAANQTLILEDLEDIKGTGFVKDTDSLVDLAKTGADADTLETLSDQIDSVYSGTPPTAAEIVNEWETQSQSDPTGFHVNVKEVNDTAQTANDNGADINTLLSRIVGTLAAGTHVAQSADNDTKLSTLLTRIVGTLAAGTHTAQSADNDTKLTTLLARVVGTLAAGTHNPQGGDAFARIGADGAGLTDLGGMSTSMKAEVNAEMVDVLETDTHAEPSGVVGATASIKDMINWLKALARNKLTQTATTATLRNDADSGNIATSTVSDDGSTATRGEWA